MNEDNVTAPNAGDRFRRAQSLVVEHLDLNPQEADATKRFGLWKRKLEIYLRALEATEDEKFNILINRLGLNSYEYVDATTAGSISCVGRWIEPVSWAESITGT